MRITIKGVPFISISNKYNNSRNINICSIRTPNFIVIDGRVLPRKILLGARASNWAALGRPVKIKPGTHLAVLLLAAGNRRRPYVGLIIKKHHASNISAIK